MCASEQYRQLSYQELAFHLEDSASFRARLPLSWSPQKSVLQKTISAIRPQTWEQINRALLSGAREAQHEDGAVVRLDSTVTAALMHEPSDSSLLWDAVRVMVRLLKQADRLVGDAGLEWRDHCRAAEKRARPNRLTYRLLSKCPKKVSRMVRMPSSKLTTPCVAMRDGWPAMAIVAVRRDQRRRLRRLAALLLDRAPVWLTRMA